MEKVYDVAAVFTLVAYGYETDPCGNHYIDVRTAGQKDESRHNKKKV